MSNSKLVSAVGMKNCEIVKFLLDNGERPDHDDCLLHFAVRLNHNDMVSLLLPYCSLEKKDLNGSTPIFEANSVEMVNFLLSCGAKIDVMNNNGEFCFDQNSISEEVATTMKEAYDRQKAVIVPVTEAVQKGSVLPWGERFNNQIVSVHDLKLEKNDKKDFCISLDGEKYIPSKRFMVSFARMFKFSANIFNYFSEEEVFGRVAEHNPDTKFRVTIDHENSELLGVVDASKKILPSGTACKIFADDPRLQKLDYENGIFEANLQLDKSFNIPQDSDYQQELFVHFPVDGLGSPCIYLGVLRQVCINGTVAMVPGFRTDIEINDESGTHLAKLLRSYNNENGYGILEERMQTAQKTEASINELMRIEKLIGEHVLSGEIRTQLQEKLMEVAGDPCEMYRTTSLQNIPQKRRAMLPAGCSVNDLFIFSSELATHHDMVLAKKRPFDMAIGQMMSQEYDLEGLYSYQKSAPALVLEGMDFTIASNRGSESGNHALA